MNTAVAPLFRMQGISKRYGGVLALEDARLECRRGRIHAVLGENGAGKSTLIKIMSGVVQPDSGMMEIEGTAGRVSPSGGGDKGRHCLHLSGAFPPSRSNCRRQHLYHQSSAKIWPHRSHSAAPDRQKRRSPVPAHSDIHPLARVKDLPFSRRQMVEIAKALARDPNILILDEATSALTAGDVATVFKVLKQFRRKVWPSSTSPIACMKLPSSPMTAPFIATAAMSRHSKSGTKSDSAIVEMMIGREYQSVFPAQAPARVEWPPCSVCSQSLLGRQASRYQLRLTAGRDRRARRPRRTGSARPAARTVRRAVGRFRLGRDRGKTGKARQPARCKICQRAHGADPGRPQD